MEISLQLIADQVNCKVHGNGELKIRSVCTLQNGSQGAITFLANRKYKKYLSSTKAAAVILREEDVNDCPVSAIISDNPYACYARIAKFLTETNFSIEIMIHETAQIASTATIGKNVSIGAFSVIGANAKVADNVSIETGCHIGNNTQVGENSVIHPNVTIYPGCEIGSNALIHSGAVIGADGFGIAQDNGRWEKVPQLGRVIIGNDVEIGASTTIDRGAIEDTTIEDGVKLDNQIQVGHNVRIGAHTAVAGCVGIAGSADIGKRCTIAAMTLVLGHIRLADDVHITAQSMVTKSINEPGVYSSGTPLQDNASWKRNFTRINQLDDIAKRLKKLEKHLLNK